MGKDTMNKSKNVIDIAYDSIDTMFENDPRLQQFFAMMRSYSLLKFLICERIKTFDLEQMMKITELTSRCESNRKVFLENYKKTDCDEDVKEHILKVTFESFENTLKELNWAVENYKYESYLWKR